MRRFTWCDRYQYGWAGISRAQFEGERTINQMLILAHIPCGWAYIKPAFDIPDIILAYRAGLIT